VKKPKKKPEVEILTDGKPTDEPLRPVGYDERIADEILTRIENGGLLIKVCAEQGMPTRNQFYGWMEGRPALKEAYTRARLAWADWHAEQVISLCQDAKGNFIDENGNRLPLTHEEVGARRLYIDSVKWLCGKWAPRLYGDKPVAEAPQAQEITFKWESPDAVSAPPLEASPPKQIAYHAPHYPADLSPQDWSALLRLLETVRNTIPSNSDTPPGEVFEICRKALLEHFREKEPAGA
jgi:hypothetical protein